MAVIIIDRISGKNLKLIMEFLEKNSPLVYENLIVRLDIFGGDEAVLQRLKDYEISFNREVVQGTLISPTREKLSMLFDELDNENFNIPSAQFKELEINLNGMNIFLSCYDLTINFWNEAECWTNVSTFLSSFLDLTKKMEDIEVTFCKKRI